LAAEIGKREVDLLGTAGNQARRYLTEGGWVELGSDIDGEAAGDFSGSSVAMSADGKRVAIGSWANDGTANLSGHVRIYGLTEGGWAKVGRDINGEEEGDESGGSVALSADGTRVAIGARNNDGNGSHSGQVRVYDYDPTGQQWDQVGQAIDGEADGDHSGSSVDMSADGKRVAIGAWTNGNNDSGHVRIYDLDGTTSTWNKAGQDINGEAADDYSGRSVAMSADGNLVAVGANSNNDNGSSSGHVRIYVLNGTTWNQVGQDIDGEATSDNSG
jgi:hypothetical protein